MKQETELSRRINQFISQNNFTGAIRFLKAQDALSQKDSQWSALVNKVNRHRFLSKAAYHNVLNSLHSFERFNWLLALTFLFFF